MSIIDSGFGAVSACAQILSFSMISTVSTIYDIKRVDRRMHELQELSAHLSGISDALERIHAPGCSSIRHADIKPNNILVDEHGILRLRAPRMDLRFLEGWEKDQSRYEHLSNTVHVVEENIKHNSLELDKTKPLLLWGMFPWVDRTALACVKGQGDGYISTIATLLPKSLREPSPMVLLIAWLALAFSITTRYHIYPQHRYRGSILIGSVVLATILGVAEGTSFSSTILTDLPWCLTAGTVVDLILHRASKIPSKETHVKDCRDDRDMC